MPIASRMRGLLLLSIASTAVAMAAATGTNAASSNLTVTFTVRSATELSALGCLPAAGRTGFGTVLPDTVAVTSSDCTISFGSSNDTASLHLRQSDNIGRAMHMPPSGSFQSSFGGSGVVVQSASAGVDLPRGMAVQADGKVLVAGTAAGATNDDFAVLRLRTDGTPDPGFGASGVAIAPMGAGIDTGYAVVVQPADQRIVVVGTAAGSGNLAVARFTTAGAPDLSFNGTGKNVSSVGTSTTHQASMAVALQADGKIVTAGYSEFAPGNADIVVSRFRTDGTLDPSFGTGGSKQVAITATMDIARGVAIDPDGRIVVTGRILNGTRYDLVTLRLTPDGALDTTFNGTGYNRHQVGTDDYGRSVAVQADGSVIVGGYAKNATNFDMVAVRYLVDGTLDPSFGTGGASIVPVGTGDDEAYSVLLPGDGRIYLGGYSDSPTQRFTIVRLLANGSPDPSFNTNGKLAFTVGTATSQIGALGFGLDGDLVAGGMASGANGDFAATVLRAVPVSDYAIGSSDFTGGGSMFGACLRATGAGAATDGTTWTPSATCPASSGTHWHAVPAAIGAASKVATAGVSGTRTATASLRFAVRPGLAQTPGSYVAPVTFEVLAPG